ncbi:hypothetical protein CWR48_04885 [Oceanobacillus arenosus]|uniref:DUF4181 domain-containing protein n=1 Tax=Oceanobacillus arenosus TaxID=1229153 RepID=A0A3D8PWB9_9BACI|nr:hypothetical protein CWR48_04885 [Oceanobacillus arenosus]
MNNAHRWVERILLLLFLIIIGVGVFKFTLSQMDPFVILFGYFSILFGFRAVMEFKYERGEQEYVINLIWAIAWCILFIALMFFIV